MTKLLLSLTIICLAILIFGTTYLSQNPLFWLASGTAAYQHVRELLVTVLAIQLLTPPPRRFWFRLLAGGIASATGVWAVMATYSSQMLFLDTLCFLGCAIAIGVVALERNLYAEDVIRVASPHRKPMIYHSGYPTL